MATILGNRSLKHHIPILILVVVMSTVASTVSVFAFPFSEIKQGEPVPDVTLFPMDAGLTKVNFSGQKGKPFIVVLWGADLPEKVEYSANILKGIEEFAPFLNQRNIERFSVNVQDDDAAAIQEVLSASKSSLAVYTNKGDQAYSLLGIYVIPAVLLVDKDGRVAAGMGYSSDIAERLKGSVEIMLGEKTAEEVTAELRPEMIESSDETKAIQRHYGYGVVMVKRGQFDAAIREFSKVIEIDPDMKEAHLQLGELYLKQNDPASAEPSIDKLLKLEPESVLGQIYRGELLRLKQQYEEARKQLQNVVKAYPDDFRANYYLGRIWADKKDQKEAMARFKKAYKLILKNSVQEK